MYGYGMYNNPQASVDRINNQIKELENMKLQFQNVPQQPPTTPSINQTFQLAPNSQNGVHYARDIEDVKKEIVIADTPFFDKDLSIMWLKNAKGEIKTYELKEMVIKDEKDMLIESLQMQINELRRGIEIAKPINTNDDGATENEKPTNVRNSKSSKSK